VAVSFYFQRILNPVGRWAYYRRPFHEGGVVDWKLELDALIESTMAFVKDVKPQSISDLALVVRTAEQALADTSKPIPLPAAVAPMTWLTSERDEILQRVSNFRAHQEKMAREREDYYLQAKAKMLAAIDPIPASGQKLC
jgi:cytochrome c556